MSTFGRSFFGSATDRLARLLRLDGTIPVELGKTITPVVILGDGTSPGKTGLSGSRWMASCSAPIAGQTYSTPADGDGIIIDGIMWSLPGVSGSIRIEWSTPAQVAAIAAGTPIGQLMDFNAAGNPPFLQHAGAMAAGTLVSQFLQHVVSTVVWHPLGFYLAPGCGISVRCQGAATGTANIIGRLP